MPYMADTNILLRFIAPEDPNHILVRNLIYSLLNRAEEICYTSQTGQSPPPDFSKPIIEEELAIVMRVGSVINQL
ncbi:MAG: hypothetical protein PUP92_38000 [Rhizonema sp. PD38]|nr:hypothetical protein [Rhizonema sp. PD38]